MGRPAVSCKQHQLEHQKCPDDCPRRRSTTHHERSSSLIFPTSFLTDEELPTYISPPTSPSPLITPANRVTTDEINPLVNISNDLAPEFTSQSPNQQFNSITFHPTTTVIPWFVTSAESRDNDSSPSVSVYLRDQCAPIAMPSNNVDTSFSHGHVSTSPTPSHVSLTMMPSLPSRAQFFNSPRTPILPPFSSFQTPPFPSSSSPSCSLPWFPILPPFTTSESPSKTTSPNYGFRTLDPASETSGNKRIKIEIS